MVLPRPSEAFWRCLLLMMVSVSAADTAGEAGPSHRSETPAGPDGLIQAFVLPHSHMDVGWIYTVKESMEAYAANVYTTVVANLVADKNRRFIAVEQEFFRLWWTTVANATQKNQTHELIKSGQMEFIIGGQVMHDEAVTEYSATIQQMTEGHSFIYDTFGKRPHFSWHVDPFGASAATPTLFALMGFDAHLTSRIDYDQKERLQQDQGLQFVWRASPSLGTAQQIFTHIMDQYSYCVPPALPFSSKSGFYWNGYVVFPRPPADGHYPHMSLPVTEENIHQYAATMVANIKQRAAWFQTQQLLWPWGCDKQFFNASVQFENMDKLMRYINDNSQSLGVQVQYATLGEYFEAVHQTNMTWGLKEDGDFLSYSSGPNSPWTGFYTSRSHLKGVARRAQAILHAGETLFSIYLRQPNVSRTTNVTETLESLKQLRWAAAEVQHHDGVTGTESVDVVKMFLNDLQDGDTKTKESMRKMLQDLTKMSNGNVQHVLTYVEPDSVLDVNEEVPLLSVLVYNPLGWSVKRLVQVKVKNPNVTIIDMHGRDIGSQVNPPLFYGGPYTLFFYAQLAPLNFEVYTIKSKGNPGTSTAHMGRVEHLAPARQYQTSARGSNRTPKGPDVRAISNDCYEVLYSSTTNMLIGISDKQNGKTVMMEQVFREYYSHHNVLFGQESNLYVFRPWGSSHPVGSTVNLSIVTGPYVNETRQSIFYDYNPNESQLTVTLRLFDLPHSHDDDIVCGHIELDFQVGPLTPNKELVYRFSTKMDTGGFLYTNDNGFQTTKRAWRPKMPEPVSQNYYPLVSTAYMQSVSSDIRLTVMAERSHGVASLTNGQMEVMLLRRLITNSGYAGKNNLTLEDPAVVTPTLWLLLGNCSHSSELQKRAWLQLENPPIIMTINQTQWQHNKLKPDADKMLHRWRKAHRSRPLPTVLNDLPPNVHLLTFKVPGWNYSTHHEAHMETIQERLQHGRYDSSEEGPNLDRFLLRLQHLYENGEHPKWSQPVKIDLDKYLSPFGTLANVSERSLTAVWPLKQVKRWTWKVKGTAGDGATKRGNSASDGLDGVPVAMDTVSSGEKPSASHVVTLNPQEIKTFFVTFQKGRGQ